MLISCAPCPGMQAKPKSLGRHTVLSECADPVICTADDGLLQYSAAESQALLYCQHAYRIALLCTVLPAACRLSPGSAVDCLLLLLIIICDERVIWQDRVQELISCPGLGFTLLSRSHQGWQWVPTCCHLTACVVDDLDHIIVVQLPLQSVEGVGAQRRGGRLVSWPHPKGGRGGYTVCQVA